MTSGFTEDELTSLNQRLKIIEALSKETGKSLGILDYYNPARNYVAQLITAILKQVLEDDNQPDKVQRKLLDTFERRLTKDFLDKL